MRFTVTNLSRRTAPQHDRRPGVGWLREAGTRMRTHWLAKMLGTMAAMGAFFAAYFWLLRHPLYPITIMPLTALDRIVGFRPAALPVYLSLWLYVSLAPGLLVGRREILAYVLAVVGLGVFGLGTFLVWPTAVPPSGVNWSQHPAFGFLQAADAAGNACPSLHVAFAVLTAMWLGRSLRQMGAGRGVRSFNWLWCGGILYSTVAIRQHVALDVLAGSALGAAIAGLLLRWVQTPTRRFDPGFGSPATSCSGPGTTHR